MQRRPYKPKMMNHRQGGFNPYNQCYRFPISPAAPGPQYTQWQPFNRNQASYKQNFNEEHWCETCDRGFNSSDVLEKHKQQHQKCNIDGCQFVAHPKVITKHIQMQHASGLYKKIARLNNPEEIQKWRDERKKKYPTKENIEKKAAEIKEKINRGEKMGLNKDRNGRHFSKGKSTNKDYANENKFQNRRRQQAKPNNTSLNKIKKHTLPKRVHNELPSADNLRKLKPFAGIQEIVMEYSPAEVLEDTNVNFAIEDDDCEELPKPMQDTGANDSEPKVCGALSTLMCEYDFSDDDDMNDSKPDGSKSDLSKCRDIKGNTQIKNCLISENVNNINNNIVAANETKSDDEGPEEIKIDKPTEEQLLEMPSKIDNSSRMKKKVIPEKKPIRNHFAKPRHKIPSTLLQKLLKREVEQERNIVLQCVRHIVKNNFFNEN